MRKVVHDLADQITKAILPITYQHKNYADILDAMCVVMAKTIQSTPAKGSEMMLVDVSHKIITDAVSELMKIDAEDNPVLEGMAEFSKFAKEDE